MSKFGIINLQGEYVTFSDARRWSPWPVVELTLPVIEKALDDHPAATGVKISGDVMTDALLLEVVDLLLARKRNFQVTLRATVFPSATLGRALALLLKSPHLTELSLVGCGHGDTVANILLRARPPALERLTVIREPTFGDNGAVAVSVMLVSSATLFDVNLSNSDIGRLGATHLKHAVQAQRDLTDKKFTAKVFLLGNDSIPASFFAPKKGMYLK